MATLKILMVSSEVAPFAKNGGLADVVSGLSKALGAAGHEVRIVMPFYGSLKGRVDTKILLSPMGVPMGAGTQEWCAVHETLLSKGIPVYLIEHNAFFERSGIYHDRFGEFGDNARRFGFFSKAALQLCRDLAFSPDVIHAHDWPTAILPAYLNFYFRKTPVLSKTASVLTLHNIGYQGHYPRENWSYLGLPDSAFCESQFESWGQINLLKGGIHHAGHLTTVSPTHAKEILSPEGGKGLAPYLSARSKDFTGILNGADYDIWNPETDTLIPARYSAKDLKGKALCKKQMQADFHLDQNASVPAFGIISRLTEQKGLHLLMPVMDSLFAEQKLQVVVLGDGEQNLVSALQYFSGKYPGRFASFIGYDERRSHLVEAGADFFLMPSLYEPCGLNQIYSLRYGTLPIVRATGGLKDTIRDYQEKDGSGTGFVFEGETPETLRHAIYRALEVWKQSPAYLKSLIQSAMSERFDWDQSSKHYVRCYETACKKMRGIAG